jgi:predicted metalloprotease
MSSLGSFKGFRHSNVAHPILTIVTLVGVLALCTKGSAAAQYLPDARVARERKVLRDASALQPTLNQFWTQELDRLYHIPFRSVVRLEYYNGDRDVPCGGRYQSLPNNAFYCPVPGDEHIAFDMNWFQNYLEKSPGGVTTFLILAHEWGHAVQSTWLENNGADVWNPEYRRELNADCLAGAFLSWAISNHQIIMEDGDWEGVWDWLYASGGPWLSPTDHGTREQRLAAFTDGYQQGTNDCRVRY